VIEQDDGAPRQRSVVGGGCGFVMRLRDDDEDWEEEDDDETQEFRRRHQQRRNNSSQGLNNSTRETNLTLNNQVPPGTRANNYWDNFKR
jgi:hypothetical protein